MSPSELPRSARSGVGRLLHAGRALPPERRLAAGAALALFVTLFLPWYQETVISTGVASKFATPSASLTGWAAFSFVEAAVLVVGVSILVLLFVRAEGQAFHVPGGDGGVIFAAGLWTAVLILWRMFDKSSTTGHGQYVTTSGVEWGIFIALGVAALLAYAGSQIKLAHEPEPPLPGERPTRRKPPTPAAEDELDVGWLTPEHSSRPPLVAPRARPANRGAGLPDLNEIEFDEPPEAPTIRQ